LWILDYVRADAIVIIDDGRNAIFAIINDLSCKSNAKNTSYEVNHNQAIDKFKNLERVALRIAA
jgi:regulator of RNase E activity RraB